MPQVPSVTSETFIPDSLIAGETQLASRSYILAAGQVVARGTVMGMITASQKMTVCTAAATDGSQTPFAVLYDTYDSTAGDLVGCGVHEKGEFDERVLTLGAGWTLATIHPLLRDVGIYLKPTVSLAGLG